MYLCMNQEACFPSFTDSTVVLVSPLMSPPAKTPGSLVCMVSPSTSGRPQWLNLRGCRASFTVMKGKTKKEIFFKKRSLSDAFYQGLVGLPHHIQALSKGLSLESSCRLYDYISQLSHTGTKICNNIHSHCSSMKCMDYPTLL